MKLTPPPIRTNTDLAIIFNSDYADSIKDYHQAFAGKLDHKTFEMIFTKFCEDQEHGFLVIVNDPNVAAQDKYFYGLAEDVPVGRESIAGCAQFWKGSEKQLKEIQDGTMEKRMEKMKKLTNPELGEFPEKYSNK